MHIRHAVLADLQALAAIERACFPPEEAADELSIHHRLTFYADHFWLLCNGEEIISFVDGMATNDPDLHDTMYADASLHRPDGRWQMIFGVNSLPQYQGRGYASQLLRRVIHDSREAGRVGLVLTCKESLLTFYGRLGFQDEGVSSSTHGGVRWHQMRLIF